MFKIHTDSLNSTTWLSGTQDAYTTYLYSPLKNVTEVAVVSANFQAVQGNVAYLVVDQLSTRYNEGTAPAGAINDSSTGPDASTLLKVGIQGALAKFNTPEAGAGARTVYRQYDYDTKTVFRTPLNKLDRLTVRLLDEKGAPLSVVSNVFVSLSFTCAQPSAQAPNRSARFVR
jgi:hypothetical protein